MERRLSRLDCIYINHLLFCLEIKPAAVGDHGFTSDSLSLDEPRLP